MAFVRAAPLPETYTLRRRERVETAALKRQPGSPDPVRWDPCRIIYWVMNPENAPAGGLEELLTDFTLASALTGFQFHYAGTTTETAGQHPNRKYLPSVYGERWSPVLVTWKPRMLSETGSEVYGTAAPIAAERANGSKVWVTGTIRLNAYAFAGWLASETLTRREEQAVVLHEIGHLLGLGHSENPNSLMYPIVTRRVAVYDAEDIYGLRDLADGDCIPDL